MKKIVRLTESDIRNMVKQVLRENDEYEHLYIQALRIVDNLEKNYPDKWAQVVKLGDNGIEQLAAWLNRQIPCNPETMKDIARVIVQQRKGKAPMETGLFMMPKK